MTARIQQVDTDSLRAAGRTYRSIGQQVGLDIDSLKGTVTGSGSPWGADEAGTLFGTAYTEILQYALDVFASMADQLFDVADGLVFSGDLRQDRERDTAAMLETPDGSVSTA